MFIDFEGIDGSGKTTLSEKLLEKLESLGLRVQHTRAKGKWKARLSGVIRAATRDPRNLDMDALPEMLLYVARDAQMVREFIKPALDQGVLVLADRYLYSHYSMCHYGRGLPLEQVDSVCQMAADGVWPDLVLYIDVDLGTSRWRKRIAKIRDRRLGDSGRKGMAGLGLRRRMRDGFLELAARDPQRWVVIDNVHDSIEQVFTRVWAVVAERLQQAGLLPAATEIPAVTDGQDLGVVPPAAYMRQQADSILNRPAGDERRSALEEHFYALQERFTNRWPDLAALLLSGLDSERDYQLRRRLLPLAPQVTIYGLDGLDSPAAWDMRRETTQLDPEYTVLTLRSLDNRAAWKLRERLQKQVPAAVARSLIWIDSPRADNIRKRLFSRVPEAVLLGLARVDGRPSWDLRERAQGNEPLAPALARSLTGLESERAWKLREKLLKNHCPWVLQSLSGSVAERAWELRRRYLDTAAKIILSGLSGLDDPAAWEMRRQRLSWAKEALDSIKGMDQPQAWELREAATGLWENTLVGSLEGLDSERAWEMRWESFKRDPENLILIKHLVEAGRLPEQQAKPATRAKRPLPPTRTRANDEQG